jgi:hypothetical protein
VKDPAVGVCSRIQVEEKGRKSVTPLKRTIDAITGGTHGTSVRRAGKSFPLWTLFRTVAAQVRWDGF